MNKDKQLLNRIAYQLDDMNYPAMTEAEKIIVKFLAEAGYLQWDEDKQCYRITPEKKST